MLLLTARWRFLGDDDDDGDGYYCAGKTYRSLAEVPTEILTYQLFPCYTTAGACFPNQLRYEHSFHYKDKTKQKV